MSNNMKISTFDIDGVIFMGWDTGGVYPGPRDVLITGRSFEEILETLEMLKEKGIDNVVYFNPLPYEAKTRESSGEHKARTIKLLQEKGYIIQVHFDDDPIQTKIITKECPDVKVVLLKHNLIEKENTRHVRH